MKVKSKYGEDLELLQIGHSTMCQWTSPDAVHLMSDTDSEKNNCQHIGPIVKVIAYIYIYVIYWRTITLSLSCLSMHLDRTTTLS